MKTNRFIIDKIKKRISISDEAAFRELFNNYYHGLLIPFIIVKSHEYTEDFVLEVLHSN